MTVRDSNLNFYNISLPAISATRFQLRVSRNITRQNSPQLDCNKRVFETQYDILSFDPRVRSLEIQYGAIANWPNTLGILDQLAAERDTLEILKYMTMDNVVRDMLRITQKFGFEKLQYYGLSLDVRVILKYGSILGATFAALFPDKVEHILIDGAPDSTSLVLGQLKVLTIII
ncbi:hypothetical protein C8R44DRAFT_735345 [Mycena epipterygia]|nr:hypothetical protein C8R44DRAFT_735345 [Mycena epipterygia]